MIHSGNCTFPSPVSTNWVENIYSVRPTKINFSFLKQVKSKQGNVQFSRNLPPYSFPSFLFLSNQTMYTCGPLFSSTLTIYGWTRVTPFYFSYTDLLIPLQYYPILSTLVTTFITRRLKNNKYANSNNSKSWKWNSISTFKIYKDIFQERLEEGTKGSMCSRWLWNASNFRWPELDLSLSWSVFRWPAALDLSYWNVQETLSQWNFWLVDDVLWVPVTCIESLALFTMLCCFYLCCGCTLWF